uniref:Uncharacterized protein n=1 Tax=Romanomermis culicivorax TaxID=13658 RepID=A0A915JVG5_ROMCU
MTKWKSLENDILHNRMMARFSSIRDEKLHQFSFSAYFEFDERHSTTEFDHILDRQKSPLIDAHRNFIRQL